MAAPVSSSTPVNVNVGVLGHVDSGKTSLVRALSTLLSTAALDRHPQSRERGMTLDLGFSAFLLPPLSDGELQEEGSPVQVTLVDCPGHASLLRTIIGGAQIIDMMLLVMDATKGIQAQTAECLVIAEITANALIIVLNKVDLIPPAEREETLQTTERRVRHALARTKFADAPMAHVSAAAGGGLSSGNSGGETGRGGGTRAGTEGETVWGAEELLRLIREHLRVPQRQLNGPFFFSVDHCFPIKGHGTVLTGTALSGAVSVGETIELPELHLQRKVKSMQKFRQSTRRVQQGDRAGICLRDLDPKLVERGIVATPGSVPRLTTVLALVRKVRYFQGECRTKGQFHLSIGHSTIMATAHFFGARELIAKRAAAASTAAGTNNSGESKSAGDTSGAVGAISGAYMGDFPTEMLEFDWERDYEYQAQLYAGERSLSQEVEEEADADDGEMILQWALLQLQLPAYCPLGSLLIGSRLDSLVAPQHPHQQPHTGQISMESLEAAVDRPTAGTCRLAFYGPVVASISDNGGNTTTALAPAPAAGADSMAPVSAGCATLQHLRIFHRKHRTATVHRMSEVDTGTGRCRELIAFNLFNREHNLSGERGKRLITEHGDVGTFQAAFGASGQFKVRFAGDGAQPVKPGSKLFMPYKRYIFDRERHVVQDDSLFEDVSAYIRAQDQDGDGDGSGVEGDGTPPVTGEATAAPEPAPEPVRPPTPPAVADTAVEREGVVDALKGTATEDAAYPRIIASGLFSMEENIRQYVGTTVIGPNGEEGVLDGPFGKLGKCKVSFPGAGIRAEVGNRVVIQHLGCT